jgi:hypothetical protein
VTGAQRGFQIHAAAWTATNVFLFVVWLAVGGGFPWFLFPAFGWGIGLATHATAVYTRTPKDDDDDELEPGEQRAQLGYRS